MTQRTMCRVLVNADTILPIIGNVIDCVIEKDTEHGFYCKHGPMIVFIPKTNSNVLLNQNPEIYKQCLENNNLSARIKFYDYDKKNYFCIAELVCSN
jgi:hypothetical protein